MSISVQSLTKVYGQQKAIDQLSFEIGKGEIVGFLGPNGAGKSTTMKILTGFLQPDAGRAQVCGYDVQENPMLTKQKTGYLPESNPLYFDMYVREYLHFVSELHQVKLASARVNEVIERVGLTRESNKKIGQLSKGYKQRVGLAAALIHNPEVLILDEPTTGLDPNQIIEIRELIRDLGKEKTVLFSSHILQEVEAICDRVIIIHKGKLIADNAVTALQSAHSKPFIRVQFGETIEEGLIEKAIASLEKLKKTGPLEWEIVASDLPEAKKQLMELALGQNLSIVSLQTGEQSLEEVFRALTGKNFAP